MLKIAILPNHDNNKMHGHLMALKYVLESIIRSTSSIILLSYSISFILIINDYPIQPFVFPLTTLLSYQLLALICVITCIGSIIMVVNERTGKQCIYQSFKYKCNIFKAFPLFSCF